MHDFPRLLLNASIAMGTPLAVARLLGVNPQLVYRWMAELERAPAAHIDASRIRLQQALATQHARRAHPRRRASDGKTPAKISPAPQYN
jgi:transposase-like protein